MTERVQPSKPSEPVEAPELPSLPDGGLSANMPAWLRQAPAFRTPPGEEEPPSIDPMTLTGGLVLPGWLRELSDRIERGSSESPVHSGDSEPDSPLAIQRRGSVDGPGADDQPDVPETETMESPTVPVEATSVAPKVTRRVRPNTVHEDVPTPQVPYVEPPYGRIGLLLMVFAIGVIVFAIWATSR